MLQWCEADINNAVWFPPAWKESMTWLLYKICFSKILFLFKEKTGNGYRELGKQSTALILTCKFGKGILGDFKRHKMGWYNFSLSVKDTISTARSSIILFYHLSGLSLHPHKMPKKLNTPLCNSCDLPWSLLLYVICKCMTLIPVSYAMTKSNWDRSAHTWRNPRHDEERDVRCPSISICTTLYSLQSSVVCPSLCLSHFSFPLGGPLRCRCCLISIPAWLCT